MKVGYIVATFTHRTRGPALFCISSICEFVGLLYITRKVTTHDDKYGILLSARGGNHDLNARKRRFIAQHGGGCPGTQGHALHSEKIHRTGRPGSGQSGWSLEGQANSPKAIPHRQNQTEQQIKFKAANCWRRFKKPEAVCIASQVVQTTDAMLDQYYLFANYAIWQQGRQVLYNISADWMRWWRCMYEY